MVAEILVASEALVALEVLVAFEGFSIIGNVGYPSHFLWSQKGFVCLYFELITYLLGGRDRPIPIEIFSN